MKFTTIFGTIGLLLFLTINQAFATRQVLQWPSNVPINVCVPSDANANCGGNVDLSLYAKSTTGTTAGYLTKSSASRVLVDSAVYENGGNVGVGTTAPSSLLEVGVQKVNVTSAGNVGIADTTPDAPLEVVGNQMWSASASGDGDSMILKSGNLGIGSLNPSQKLDVNGSIVAATNIGIGTTTPTDKLYVKGTSPTGITIDSTGAITGGCDSSATALWHYDNSSDDANCSGGAYNATSSLQITYTTGKFGGSTGAAQFNTTGAYINYSTALGAFLTNNFTVDFWTKITSWTTTLYAWSQYKSNDDQQFSINSDGSIRYLTRNLGTQIDFSAAAGSIPTDSSWHHIALVRNGTRFDIYVDGVSKGNTTTSNTINNKGVAFQIGNYNAGTQQYLGLIDEFRVSMGTARWTTNFTPPTSAYDTTATSSPTVTLMGNSSQVGKVYIDGTDSSKLKFDVPSTTRMVINSAGNVGIGSTTPQANLDVEGSLYFGTLGSGFLKSNAGAISADSTIYQTKITTGTSAQFLKGDLSLDSSVYSVSNSQWTTSGTNLYSTLAGNVGIGSTVPDAKLTVGGTAKFTGQITSTVATGTAPFAVSSTTQVNNLCSALTQSDNTWTVHNSYPSGCAAGNAVTTIGDTVTCTPVVGSETDPEVHTLTANKWCAADATGAYIDCISNTPGGGGGGGWNDNTTYTQTNSEYWVYAPGTSYNTTAMCNSEGMGGDQTSCEAAGCIWFEDACIQASQATPAYIPTGAGTRLLWVPARGAFRAGRVADTQWKPTGSTFWDIGNLGLFSVAFGKNNLVSGSNGFGAGMENECTGSTCFVAGYNNQAGNFGTAIGTSNYVNASGGIAIGRQNAVTGTGSVALGFSNLADGESAFVVGDTSGSHGLGTISMGANCNAYGIGGVCIGQGSMASGDGGATAFGNTTKATASSSTSMGYNTRAEGIVATATGDNTDSTNHASFSMNSHTASVANNSLAQGYGTITTGADAASFNNANYCAGASSTCMGESNIVRGKSSYVNGSTNVVNGLYSSAHGRDITVTGNNTHVWNLGTDAGTDGACGYGGATISCSSFSDETNCNGNGCSWSAGTGESCEGEGDCGGYGNDVDCESNACTWIPAVPDECSGGFVTGQYWEVCGNIKTEATCSRVEGCSWDYDNTICNPAAACPELVSRDTCQAQAGCTWAETYDENPVTVSDNGVFSVMNGNVGIGTASPRGALDVDGIIYNNGHLSMRPFIEQGSVAGAGKPTIVTRGVSKGYSVPLYAADEELFISEYIAGRWDGASDITISIIGYLSAAEDVGDDFALQVSWANKATSSGVWQNTSTDVEVRTNIDTGRAAQYSIYKVELPIDWNVNDPDIVASDFFAARVRRIAVGGGYTEMSGEFVITSIVITYNVNKVFKP